MADTAMTWGRNAGLQIGGGTQPQARWFRCRQPFPVPGCQEITWSELDRPDCPLAGHGFMSPMTAEEIEAAGW